MASKDATTTTVSLGLRLIGMRVKFFLFSKIKTNLFRSIKFTKRNLFPMINLGEKLLKMRTLQNLCLFFLIMEKESITN